MGAAGAVAEIVRLSPPLFCKMTLELGTSPVTVPPMVALTGFVVHVMVTPMTLAVAVPEPATTRQVCAGLAGADKTVTAYMPPLAMVVGNVKGPFAETVRLSLLLLFRTTDSPAASPPTLPPIVYGPPAPPPPPPATA